MPIVKEEGVVSPSVAEYLSFSSFFQELCQAAVRRLFLFLPSPFGVGANLCFCFFLIVSSVVSIDRRPPTLTRRSTSHVTFPCTYVCTCTRLFPSVSISHVFVSSTTVVGQMPIVVVVTFFGARRSCEVEV